MNRYVNPDTGIDFLPDYQDYATYQAGGSYAKGKYLLYSDKRVFFTLISTQIDANPDTAVSLGHVSLVQNPAYDYIAGDYVSGTLLRYGTAPNRVVYRVLGSGTVTVSDPTTDIGAGIVELAADGSEALPYKSIRDASTGVVCDTEDCNIYTARSAWELMDAVTFNTSGDYFIASGDISGYLIQPGDVVGNGSVGWWTVTEVQADRVRSAFYKTSYGAGTDYTFTGESLYLIRPFKGKELTSQLSVRGTGSSSHKLNIVGGFNFGTSSEAIQTTANAKGYERTWFSAAVTNYDSSSYTDRPGPGLSFDTAGYNTIASNLGLSGFYNAVNIPYITGGFVNGILLRNFMFSHTSNSVYARGARDLSLDGIEVYFDHIRPLYTHADTKRVRFYNAKLVNIYGGCAFSKAWVHIKNIDAYVRQEVKAFVGYTTNSSLLTEAAGADSLIENVRIYRASSNASEFVGMAAGAGGCHFRNVYVNHPNTDAVATPEKLASIGTAYDFAVMVDGDLNAVCKHKTFDPYGKFEAIDGSTVGGTGTVWRATPYYGYGQNALRVVLAEVLPEQTGVATQITVRARCIDPTATTAKLVINKNPAGFDDGIDSEVAVPITGADWADYTISVTPSVLGVIPIWLSVYGSDSVLVDSITVA